VRLTCVIIVWIASSASPASAQEISIGGPLAGMTFSRPSAANHRYRSTIEASAVIGLVDVGIAGVDLVGHGYEHEGGPLGSIDLRAMFATAPDVHWGALARFAHTAGDSFGTLSSYGFLHLVFDVAAVFRYALRMSEDAIYQSFVGAHLGLSSAFDDAGMGNGDPSEDYEARVRAEHVLDHGSVGGVFGVDFDVRYDFLIMGVGAQLRAHWVVDSPISRQVMLSIGARMGVVFDLDRRSAPQPHYARPAPSRAELAFACRSEENARACFELAHQLEAGLGDPEPDPRPPSASTNARATSDWRPRAEPQPG
jgi:hypothetical protein